MTLFTFTASCWLVTEAVLIPGKSTVSPTGYTEEEAVLNRGINGIKPYCNSILVFYCNVLWSVEMLCINIKLKKTCRDGRTTRYKVNQNQLNRLKRVEKLHRPKSQPIFLEGSQTSWREPFDFPTGMSGFPM